MHLVEKWARTGLTEDQIAKNLGISRSTMTDYKNRYPGILATLKRGREVCVAEIENALVKRALGFEYEEVKTYIKDEGGRIVKYTEKTRKYLAPDVGVCAILLKNKDRGNWSDNPMKIDLEREMLDFRKKVEGMRMF